MRIFIITFYFSLLSIFSFAQSKLDSLSTVRESLLTDRVKNEDIIVKIEKQIISEILTYGYEYIIRGSYKNQTFDVKEAGNSGKIIAKFKDGDKVIIFGKESIYYKIKIDDIDGLIYISNTEYPISLLNDNKYKNHAEEKKENPQQQKTSGKNCSTTQCTGRTQKGLRCRNMTTNCSGRCHLH
jgi:hypothetical protein